MVASPSSVSATTCGLLIRYRLDAPSPLPSICRRLRAATLAIVVSAATLGDALIRVAGDAASPSSRDCRRPPHISRFGLRPSLQSGAAWQPLGLYFLKL